MPKAGEVLKFRDGGPSVEEARKAMKDAKEEPRGSAGGTVTRDVAADVLEPELPDGAEPVAPEIVPAAVPVAAVVPQPVPVVAAQPEIERVETAHFVGEIFQENGRWVGKITYKNGAGTERFESRTKSELMLELLRGKGHATMRVRAAVRREKLAGSELDATYPLPDDMTAEEFAALPEKRQDQLLETIAATHGLAFRDKYPEYYATETNGKALQNFLFERKRPITLRNLEFAFEDLTADDLLEKRVEVASAAAPKVLEMISAPITTIAAEDSAARPAVPPSAPAPAATVAAPVATVRRRGTTGLQPEHSSSPSELGGSGDGDKPRELSEAELRKLPTKELKRIADADRLARSTVRR